MSYASAKANNIQITWFLRKVRHHIRSQTDRPQISHSLEIGKTVLYKAGSPTAKAKSLMFHIRSFLAYVNVTFV